MRSLLLISFPSEEKAFPFSHRLVSRAKRRPVTDNIHRAVVKSELPPWLGTFDLKPEDHLLVLARGGGWRGEGGKLILD